MFKAVVTFLGAFLSTVVEWVRGAGQVEIKRLEQSLAMATADLTAANQQLSVMARLVQEKDRRIAELETVLAERDLGDLFDGVFSSPKARS